MNNKFVVTSDSKTKEKLEKGKGKHLGLMMRFNSVLHGCFVTQST